MGCFYGFLGWFEDSSVICYMSSHLHESMKWEVLCHLYNQWCLHVPQVRSSVLYPVYCDVPAYSARCSCDVFVMCRCANMCQHLCIVSNMCYICYICVMLLHQVLFMCFNIWYLICEHQWWHKCLSGQCLQCFMASLQPFSYWILTKIVQILI